MHFTARNNCWLWVGIGQVNRSLLSLARLTETRKWRSVWVHYVTEYVSRSKYNALTRPVFRAFELLTIHDLFSLNCLRFLYNYSNTNLSTYFCELTYTPKSKIHDYSTKYADLIDIETTRTVMAEKCIRVHLGNIINETRNIIMDEISTHSIYGFVFCIKIYYLDS